MSNTASIAEEDLALLERLAGGADTPSIEEQLGIVQAVRSRSRDRGALVDTFLLRRAAALGQGLAEARTTLGRLKEMLDTLAAPPWHPAVFLRPLPGDGGPRALVMHGGARRVVTVADGVDAAVLAAGEEVFLSTQLNAIVGRSPFGVPSCGEIAAFERATPDGRLVLNWRDEEVVVDAAAALAAADLQPGDHVRWERTAWIAFEKLERAAARRFLLEDVPDIGAERIGGQEPNLRALLDALTAVLVHPDEAARYRVGTRRTIFMHGPPGNGKTLLARIGAAAVQRATGRRCRIAVVKGAEWESPWVGETQRNIRETFAALRRAAEDGYAVLFIDEVEAVGRIRGTGIGHHDDKFLTALLTELDGFLGRPGIAVIGATNRKDLVDPALLQRLSGVELPVGRPDMRGARAIFAIHLDASIPYSPNGAVAPETRERVIDAAVARLYAPNGDNALCVLRFRDGTARTVAARELASGRLFEQIADATRTRAFLRAVRGGEAGVGVPDIDAAVADALERLRTTLSARNAHAYLPDLPQDVDVVGVDPVARRVPRPHRYLTR